MNESLQILIQLLPIISSFIIWILYLTIKSLFKTLVEKEKIILQHEYKLLYDKKVSIINKLDLLHTKFYELNLYRKKEYNSDESQLRIDELFSGLKKIVAELAPHINSELNKFFDNHFNFDSGYEYIKYYVVENEKFEIINKEFINHLKNERKS